MSAESPTEAGPPPDQHPPWCRASLADVSELDFEAPIKGCKDADCSALSALFQNPARPLEDEAEAVETPQQRTMLMLASPEFF